jgi:hypothetical protein
MKRGNKMAGYSQLKAWMDEKYGVSKAETTITYNGKTYTGYMYGNDECFEGNEFYQYFLTDDALLRLYYHIPEGCYDLGSAAIDYDAPYDVAVDDAQYWISMIMLYS